MDHATSETLTRTGAGTAMGKLMRRYWVPILGSAEIAEPDGPQVRVQIMGEKLLAFRDTEGKPGLIGEFCAHRGVSRRPRANRDNDYLIDRRAQKEKRAYSGVFGISEQDASLQESMGAIQDRTRELLLPTDKAIQMARRMLHEAALGLLEGREPPALDASSQLVRAAGVLFAQGPGPQTLGQGQDRTCAGQAGVFALGVHGMRPLRFPFALSLACPELAEGACPDPVEGSKGFDKLSLNGE